jgi:hypothetical protein
MVENVFNNESAESICFSNAINSELTRDDEPTTLPTTINVSHQASSAISDALLAEIEQNVENGTISHFNLEDKCERFAARLGEYKVNDGGKVKIVLTTPEGFNDEEEPKSKCRIVKSVAKCGGGKQFLTRILHFKQRSGNKPRNFVTLLTPRISIQPSIPQCNSYVLTLDAYFIQVRKKTLRSLPYNRKRSYVWKQPLKNKARHYQRLQTLEVRMMILRPTRTPNRVFRRVS